MKQYIVTGMSCAACSSRVEKAVSKVEGVENCSVSLLTNSMGVEGTASDEAVIKAVEDAGYGASLKTSHTASDKSGTSQKSGSQGMYASQDDMLKDRVTPVLKKRLITSVGFLIVLMYISMGHMMWGWPLPSILEGNHVAMGLIQMLLTIIIMVINQKFFISGFRGLLHKAPNMDTLVALGSGAAFVYSTYALFAMTDAQVRMDMDGVMHYMHEFYFESAAMILTLITVGKMLEAHSKGKTTDAIKSLMKLAPKTANIIRDGSELNVPVENVKKGDIIVANKNFGCGSSREHAPIAIKAAGVSCVIAETFARIFYRNSINIGLPIIECPEAAKAINAGDDVEVDFDSGVITDKTTGQSFKGQAFPEFMQKIIKAEGLINYINNK